MCVLKVWMYIVFVCCFQFVLCFDGIQDERLCVDADCSVAISHAKAELKYSSPMNGVLSFKAGQLMTIYSKTIPEDAKVKRGFWGAKINGKRGYVPPNLIREFKVLRRDVNTVVPTEAKQKRLQKEIAVESSQSDVVVPSVSGGVAAELGDGGPPTTPFTVVEGTTVLFGVDGEMVIEPSATQKASFQTEIVEENVTVDKAPAEGSANSDVKADVAEQLKSDQEHDNEENDDGDDDDEDDGEEGDEEEEENETEEVSEEVIGTTESTLEALTREIELGLNSEPGRSPEMDAMILAKVASQQSESKSVDQSEQSITKEQTTTDSLKVAPIATESPLTVDTVSSVEKTVIPPLVPAVVSQPPSNKEDTVVAGVPIEFVSPLPVKQLEETVTEASVSDSEVTTMQPEPVTISTVSSELPIEPSSALQEDVPPPLSTSSVPLTDVPLEQSTDILSNVASEGSTTEEKKVPVRPPTLGLLPPMYPGLFPPQPSVPPSEAEVAPTIVSENVTDEAFQDKLPPFETVPNIIPAEIEPSLLEFNDSYNGSLLPVEELSFPTEVSDQETISQETKSDEITAQEVVTPFPTESIDVVQNEPDGFISGISGMFSDMFGSDKADDSVPLEESAPSKSVADTVPHVDETAPAENLAHSTTPPEILLPSPAPPEQDSFNVDVSSPSDLPHEPVPVETLPSLSDTHSHESTVHAIVEPESVPFPVVPEGECKSIEGLESDCIDAPSPSYLFEFLDRKSSGSTYTFLYLVVTAVTVLLFTLGHYFIEKSRQDGPLIAKVNQLTRELQVATSQLESRSFKESSSLAEINNEVLIALQGQVDDLKRIKAEQEAQLEALQQELDAATEAGLELNRMLSDLLTQKNGSDNLLQSVEHLQGQLNSQPKIIDDMNRSLVEKNAENEAMQAELLTNQEKIENLEEELNEMRQSLDMHLKEKDEVTQLLESHNAKLQSELATALKSKAVEVTALSVTVTELTEKLAVRESEFTALSDTIEQLKKKDVDTKALYDVGHVKAELNRVQAERDALQERLSDEEGARSLLEEHVKAVDVEVARLRVTCEAAEKDKLAAETRLTVLSNYFKEKETQLQKELGLQEAMWVQKQGDETTVFERIKSLQDEVDNYNFDSFQTSNDGQSNPTSLSSTSYEPPSTSPSLYAVSVSPKKCSSLQSFPTTPRKSSKRLTRRKSSVDFEARLERASQMTSSENISLMPAKPIPEDLLRLQELKTVRASPFRDVTSTPELEIETKRKCTSTKLSQIVNNFERKQKFPKLGEIVENVTNVENLGRAHKLKESHEMNKNDGDIERLQETECDVKDGNCEKLGEPLKLGTNSERCKPFDDCETLQLSPKEKISLFESMKDNKYKEAIIKHDDSFKQLFPKESTVKDKNTPGKDASNTVCYNLGPLTTFEEPLDLPLIPIAAPRISFRQEKPKPSPRMVSTCDKSESEESTLLSKDSDIESSASATVELDIKVVANATATKVSKTITAKPKHGSQNEILKKEIIDQERGLKGQIATLEKKAHENWVAARQAERRLEESKQEAGQLRNMLTLMEKSQVTEVDSKAPGRPPGELNGDEPLPPLLPDGNSPLPFPPPLPWDPTGALPNMLPPGFMPPPFMHPPPSGFMPPPPPPFLPGDRRPAPLGRMSSPPLNRFSPGPGDYDEYDRLSPAPISPPVRNYRSPPIEGERFRHRAPPSPSHPSRHWDDGPNRSGFRPVVANQRDSRRDYQDSDLSSGHSSNDSVDKPSRMKV